MNFNYFLLFYLGFVLWNVADLQLTGENVALPTKYVTRFVDTKSYDKLTVDYSAKLMITFQSNMSVKMKVETAKFYFNDKPLDLSLKETYQMSNEVVNNTNRFQLKLSKFSEESAGKYTMTISSDDGRKMTATGNITSPPFLEEFPESKRKTEGERMQVQCKVTSYQPVTELSWTQLNKSEHNFRLVKSSNTSTFDDFIVWDLLVRADSGHYKCHARNDYGSDTVILQIRVRDRYAILWPVIGIAIEVLILVIIIVVYEKKKSQKKAVEASQNPLRQSLLDPKQDDTDVRQRHPKA